MIEKIAPGKKHPVKLQAVRDARGKNKKIARGDKPGKSVKKPHPQALRKINCYIIRKFFHKILYKPFSLVPVLVMFLFRLFSLPLRFLTHKPLLFNTGCG
jgi:hypothetical protein